MTELYEGKAAIPTLMFKISIVTTVLNDRYGLWAKVQRVGLEESLGKI